MLRISYPILVCGAACAVLALLLIALAVGGCRRAESAPAARRDSHASNANQQQIRLDQERQRLILDRRSASNRRRRSAAKP